MTYSEKIYHAQECREIPVYTCSCCGEGIYSEDPYYDIHGEIYCENCINEFKSYCYAQFEETA